MKKRRKLVVPVKKTKTVRKNKRPQDAAHRKATRDVAKNHPRSTRVDPKVKTTKKSSSSNNKYADLFERWKNGEALAKLAKEVESRRRPIKLAFIDLAGGKDEFAALRDAGAGGRAFGGKRGGGARTKEQRAIDDSNVKLVMSSPRWQVERNWEPAIIPIVVNGEKKTMMWQQSRMTVYVSPSGNRYVQAGMNEKADLILNSKKHKGLPPLRLRKLAESAKAKKVKQEDTLVKRGLKAQEVKKKAKEKKQKQLDKLVVTKPTKKGKRKK